MPANTRETDLGTPLMPTIASLRKRAPSLARRPDQRRNPTEIITIRSEKSLDPLIFNRESERKSAA